MPRCRRRLGRNPADPAIRPTAAAIITRSVIAGHPHFRRHLPGHGRGQAPRLPARSRRRGAARRGLMVATGVLTLDEAYRRRRHGDDRAPPRDDDRRRQSPPLRLLPDGRWLRHGAGASSARSCSRPSFSSPASSPRFLVNDTICLVMTPLVLDLVRRLEPQPGALPARRRHGLQRRRRRHHHRQPAEHDHRLARRHPLCRTSPPR